MLAWLRCVSWIARIAIFLSHIIWLTCCHLSHVEVELTPQMFSIAIFIVALVVFTPNCGASVVSLWFMSSEGSGGIWKGLAWPPLPWALSGGGGKSTEEPLGSGCASPKVWTELSKFTPELSSELWPTAGLTVPPVLGGLFRRVPSAMPVVLVAVNISDT